MSQDDIHDLQRAIHDRGHTWSVGPTHLSALPIHEQERRLGLRLEPDEMARLAAMMTEPPLRAAEFPPDWNWRDVEGKDWTTPIRDQKACGACVSFATVAVMETMIKRRLNNAGMQPDLSEAHLFFCGCGACCDKGWWPTYALDYAKNHGVPDEACFPYEDRNMPCSNSCADSQSRAVRVANWEEILDPGARKEWLATKGPLIGCMAVYRDFFSYTGGIYRHASGNLAGHHAICVVGYSEEDQAWICKNSWGPGWGESGYFKIGYGECGMDTDFAMYGVTEVTPPSPEPPTPPPPPPPPSPQPGCNVIARILQAIRGS